MALVPRTERDPRVGLIAYALASAVPFAAYLATASGHSYWLDAGEFVEAATLLDIAHPPGHPIAALLGFAFSLIPLGPIALRVALGQACCAALAGLFAYRAIETTVRIMGVRHDRIAMPIALSATWLVTCSVPWWFQAVRPEVYALEALLVSIAIERVVALEGMWPTSDVRALWPAALALGLGLANHHFIAVLTFPAFMPTLARVYRARGGRVLWRCAAALATGLASYAYLPVRSRALPPVDLGHPADLGSLAWVVSARVYQHSHAISRDGPAMRAADVMVALIENVPAVVLVFAIAGAWAMWKTPGASRIAWIWVALFGFSYAGRAWLGQTRGNPDALGYLVPAFLGLGALSAAFVAAIAASMAGARARPPRKLMTAIAFACAALSLSTLFENRVRASLAGFHATDDFDQLRVRELPYRSVVIVHLPQTAFRHWELLATERARPDLTLVALPFLGYPGFVRRLLRDDPMLTDLVRTYAASGALSSRALQSLAERRPVFVELDVRVPRDLFRTLVPDAIYHRVLDSDISAFELEDAAARRAASLTRLERALGTDEDDPETRNQLLWLHYMDALYYAHLGARQRARESLDRALSLQPEETQLRAFDAALVRDEGRGPIDITPFMVGPAAF